MTTITPPIPSDCLPPANPGASVVAHGPAPSSGAGIPDTCWFVTVDFPASPLFPDRFPAVIHKFRFATKAKALKCKREFSHPGCRAVVTVKEHKGYVTFEGWVDAA